MMTRTVRKQIVFCGMAIMAGMAGLVQAAYVDAVTADSPIAYWRFSETSGNSVADSAGSYTASIPSGGDVDLNVNGPDMPGFGSGNSAAGFNGDLDGDKLDTVTASLGHNDVGGGYGFTIEAWVNGGTGGTVATLTASISFTRFYGASVAQVSLQSRAKSFFEGFFKHKRKNPQAQEAEM